MITFVIGLIVGNVIGVFVTALAVAADDGRQNLAEPGVGVDE